MFDNLLHDIGQAASSVINNIGRGVGGAVSGVENAIGINRPTPQAPVQSPAPYGVAAPGQTPSFTPPPPPQNPSFGALAGALNQSTQGLYPSITDQINQQKKTNPALQPGAFVKPSAQNQKPNQFLQAAGALNPAARQAISQHNNPGAPQAQDPGLNALRAAGSFIANPKKAQQTTGNALSNLILGSSAQQAAAGDNPGELLSAVGNDVPEARAPEEAPAVLSEADKLAADVGRVPGEVAGTVDKAKNALAPIVSSVEDPIAHALGMTPEDLAAAKKGTSENYEASLPKQTAPPPGPHLATPEERADIIDHQAGQQTVNQIAPQADNAKSVVAETEGIVNERAKRFNDAINVGNKLSDSDKAKLSDAVNGLAVKPENPTLFTKTVDMLRDAYDYSLASDRAGGGQTLRWNNGKYSPLYLKATADEMDKAAIPDSERVIKNGNPIGYRADARTIRSYRETNRTPLNTNALEDARMYANQGAAPVRHGLLLNGLAKTNPGEITNDLNVRQMGNTQMVHAANGNLPFNVSQRLNATLNGYKSGTFSNPAAEAAMKGVSAVTNLTRKVAFIASPIHKANLTRSFLSTMAPSGHLATSLSGEVKAIASSFGPSAYDALEKSADTKGIREYARGLGLVEKETRPNLLTKGTSIAGKVERWSPFGMAQRDLNRFNNVLMWKVAEKLKDVGVVPGSENGMKIATEMNKVLDTINSKAEGLNPLFERLMSNGSIAPHWIRANLGLVKDTIPVGIGRSFDEHGNSNGLKFTLGKGGSKGFGITNPGDIARTNVVGGHLLFGGIAVIASAIASGKMPTLANALMQAGLSKENNFSPTVQAGQTNTKGESAVTNIPTDPVGMAASLFLDPAHFLTARETPLLSAVTQYATNKDWAGNQIEDPSQPGWREKLAVKVAENALTPFTAQNASNSLMTPAQKIAATFGFRTHRDPSDPNYQSSVNYENAMQKAVGGASQPDAEAITTYLSRQVDGSGQKIKPGTVGGYNNAKLLLGNAEQGGQALARIYSAQHALPNNDPLWKLPLNAGPGQSSVTAYLKYQGQYEGPEKTGTKENLEGAQAAAANNGWIDQLTTARNAYYNKLPPGNDAAAKEPAYPTFSTQATSDLAAYNKLPAGTSANNFLNSHQDVTDAFASITGWENKIRLLEGAPTTIFTASGASPQVEAAINTYDALPASKTAGNTDPATQHARSNWIKQNPGLYNQMSQYFATSSGASLIKNAIEASYSGQNLNDQAFLKEAKSFGADVTQNANGTYSSTATGGTSSGYTPYSSGSSSSGGGSASNYIHLRFPEAKNLGPLRVNTKAPKHVQFKFHAQRSKPANPVIPGGSPRASSPRPVRIQTTRVQSKNDTVGSSKDA